MRKLLLAIALALALPGVARAGLVTMVARDVPLGPRGLEAAAVPARFDMLGVHWRGSGTVAYRVRSTSGNWSVWRPVDDDSGPDLGSPDCGGAMRNRPAGTGHRLTAQLTARLTAHLGSLN